MKHLQRLIYLLLPLMLFFLPFAVSFGRLFFFGFGGWLIIIALMILAPALFILLLGVFLITPKRYDSQGRKIVSAQLAVLYIMLYALLFLFNFFIVDAGDTGPSMSAASRMFGESFIDTSNTMSGVFFVLVCLMILSLYVCAIVERVCAPRFTRQVGQQQQYPNIAK